MQDYLVVDEIALAVISHRHHDHQGGMDDILRIIKTNAFLGIADDCPNRIGDDKVRQALNDNNVPALFIQSGANKNIEVLIIDGVRLTILPLPGRSQCPSKENLNSIMVRLDYGEFSMLFTGDAEEQALDFYVENYPELLDVDVLKASHHGSNNGYTDAFLAAVSPTEVVISAGVNARYRHPHRRAVMGVE